MKNTAIALIVMFAWIPLVAWSYHFFAHVTRQMSMDCPWMAVTVVQICGAIFTLMCASQLLMAAKEARYHAKWERKERAA